jgi:hypothetical protein
MAQVLEQIPLARLRVGLFPMLAPK